MPGPHTILLAGGADTERHLGRALSAVDCRLLRATSTGETLTLAGSATVIVVDELFSEGATQLCQQLRADPVTSRLPLVFVYRNGQPALARPLVDAHVLAGDTSSLWQTLSNLVPGLASEGGAEDWPDAAGPGVQAEAFDEDLMTVVWRKPAGSAEAQATGWPPPPPERQPDEDLGQFASNFAGYLNCIIEALEDPSRLSVPEAQRLGMVLDSTSDAAAELVSTVQSAMNQALASKDLHSMKVLSTAKNSLYEKLQRLRVLARSFEPASAAPKGEPATGEPAPQPATPELGANAAATASSSARSPTPASGSTRRPTPSPLPARRGSGAYDTSQGGAASEHEESSSGRESSSALRELTGSEMALPGTKKKSELTLAAEAKKRQQREAAQTEAAQRMRARAKEASSYGYSGTARKESRLPGSTWLWAAIATAAVVIGGLYIWYSLSSRAAAPTAESGPNAAPQMLEVKLRETPAGIVVRPQARDADGDRVSYQVRWYVDGTRVQGERTARLPPEHYGPGAIVHVKVRPTDGTSHGQPLRSRDHRVKAEQAAGNQ